MSLPRDKDQPRKRIRSPKKPDLAGRVKRFAVSHRLWKKGERILVAVSGGADSVALLHLLYRLKEEEDLKLTVVHLDHGLRGQASEADSRWVRELAGRLDIPCLVERRVVSAKLRRGGHSPEESARDVRYTFFRDLSERTGINTLALGHHADDQAETVLLKLLRGCHPAGLGGMRPYRLDGTLRLIRPLLEIRRRELVDFLSAIGESFREDISNRDRRFLRNRLRHELLPLLETEYNPRIREVLVHLAGMERKRDDYLKDRMHESFQAVAAELEQGLVLDLPLFKQLSSFEQGEILRELLWKAGFNDPHRRVHRDLERIIKGPSGRRLTLPGRLTVLKEQQRLIIKKGPGGVTGFRAFSRELAVPGETEIELIRAGIVVREYPRPPEITFRPGPGLKRYWEDYPGGGVLKEYLDRDTVVLPLLVRSRRPGDRYQPLGTAGNRKIKKILIDEKVPGSLRDLIPIIADAEKIIWLAGYRPDHRCRVREETRTILEISLVPLDLSDKQESPPEI
ncbi:MAG: tRNA lysidine(34) synthetase TilS [Candidatus Euphemobacter frigidus]|nr:tRNA lysidine(34) synthetase TilS [Candidatus Euphemobacter frigidus]MDP8275739.1 tRNA lysidine(34) synthetase TilS [Candidatus Euphemobacter frigidus]